MPRGRPPRRAGSSRSRRGSACPFRRSSPAPTVVPLIFPVLEVLLLLLFVFKLTGANSNQPLIAALYGATEPLVRPFQGIFPEPQGPPVFDIAAVLSIGFLFLIGLLIVALLRAITNPKRV